MQGGQKKLRGEGKRKCEITVITYARIQNDWDTFIGQISDMLGHIDRTDRGKSTNLDINLLGKVDKGILKSMSDHIQPTI